VNQYIFIAIFNGYIHLSPQNARSASDYVSSFASILAFFTPHFLPLPSLIVDNETSLECREYFLSQRLPLQFVPPQIHRTNPVERAVRTVKTHLIAFLSSTHPDFPDDLWNRLLPTLPGRAFTASFPNDFIAHPANSASPSLILIIASHGTLTVTAAAELT
jgi:hypothetical protein